MTLKKRFVTFHKEQIPVVTQFEKVGKVIRVDATSSIDSVYQTILKGLGYEAPKLPMPAAVPIQNSFSMSVV